MAKIRIGLDARFALGVRRGIGNFSLDLFRALARVPHPYELVFFSDREDTGGLLSGIPESQVKVLRPGFYPSWEQVTLPAALLKEGISLFHSVGNTAPFLLPRKIKLVLTIHDVMFLKPISELPRSPSWYQRLGRIYRSAVAPRAARRADLVLTDSNFSREDILASIPRLDPAKVQVAYIGLPGHFLAPEAGGDDDPMGGQAYLLHLGALDPRKNSAAVVRTFLELRRQGAIQEQLVVLGMRDLGSLNLSYSEAREAEAWIRIPGFVPDTAIPSYYRHAQAFLFPSFYEGFGLPLLEAMACGTPIITSKESSLPEIAGNAALFIDPRNPEELKESIKTILGSQEIQADLVRKGKERIKDFAWETIARQTFEAFGAVLESARP